MNRLIIGVVLAGTFACGVALAAQSNDLPARPDDGKRVAGWLAHHGDKNGDGAVSRDEFLAQAAARFAELDVNKDGKISADEAKAAMLSRRGRFAREHDKGMVPPHGGPGGARGPEGRGGPGGPGGISGFLERLDVDKDGKISRAEFNAPNDRRFDLLDTNKDGVIDQSELAAARERMRAQMEEMRKQWRSRADGGDAPPPAPPQNQNTGS